jgi:hypothetical protein
MAGQSASLTLKESKAMQERVQCKSNNSKASSSKTSNGGDSTHRKAKKTK